MQMNGGLVEITQYISPTQVPGILRAELDAAVYSPAMPGRESMSGTTLTGIRARVRFARNSAWSRQGSPGIL